MDYTRLADNALQNLPLTKDECLNVLRCPEEEILALLQAAFKVRRNHFGRKVYLHVLINAKSGLCPEDCAYCSQSSISEASIEKYPLLDEETIMEGSRAAREAKAKRYCIVSSGREPHGTELERISKSVQKIKQEVEIEICASLGFLTEEGARMLKESGVDRYNHNLNASERFYPDICSTHTSQDRIKTLLNARKAGMELCCGALFGMGENDDDIVDTIFAIREIAPESIPANFLHPIAGTPLEEADYLTPLKCLAILCLMRLLNPGTEIRVAGGREYHLRSLQALALYPANSLFVSGYLTTSGQTPEQVWKMIEDLGFEVEEERSVEVAARSQG